MTLVHQCSSQICDIHLQHTLNLQLVSDIHLGNYMAHVLTSYGNETDCIYRTAEDYYL
jgi:hypothetical protein